MPCNRPCVDLSPFWSGDRFSFGVRTVPDLFIMKDRITFLSVAAIIALGLFVYAGSLDGSFIWDDEDLIRDNLRIRDLRNIPKIFTEDIGAGSGKRFNFYRPIQTLSYMADYALWRLEPRGYHLTSILLHILAALILYWLIKILYDDRLISFFTGAFFVIHPAHTEAVAYISGRADLLAFIFVLLTLIFYIRHIQSEGALFYFAALSCSVLALLSREGSIILCGLIPLYHYTFRKKITLKNFPPIAAVSLCYLVFRTTALGSAMPDLSAHPPLIERIPSIFAAFANYIRILFLPLDLHMEYGNRLFSAADPMVIAGLLAAFAFLMYIARSRKGRGAVFFAISWFFISLIPVSGIYPLNAYMAEHWLYLPSVGFFIILAKGIGHLCRRERARMFGILLAGALFLFYSHATIRQCGYWKDPFTFYERTLEYAPHSYKVKVNLANAHLSAKRYEKAIFLYRQALELKPDYADAYYNMGNAYGAGGDTRLAIASYEKAIEMKPGHFAARNNLGNIYSAAGDSDRAEALYKKAIELNPEYADAYYNLGNEYRRRGNDRAAIGVYKECIEINPYQGAAHNNLAVSYYNLGEYGPAIEHRDKAISLGCPVHPEFFELLEQRK